MKRKNLERAVLLTVAMMSLHGAAGAADDVVNTDINTDTTQIVDSIKAETGHTVNVTGSNDLTVGTAEKHEFIHADGGSIIFDTGHSTTVGNANVNSAVLVDGGSLEFKDGSALTIKTIEDGYIYKGSTNINAEGLKITGDNANVTFGNSGLKIDLNLADDASTDHNYNLGIVSGLNMEAGNATVNGNLDIDITAQHATGAHGIYLEGTNNKKVLSTGISTIDIINYQSAAYGAIINGNSEFNAEQMDVNVKSVTGAVGVDVASGSTAELGSVNVTATTIDGNKNNVGIYQGIVAEIGGIITLDGGVITVSNGSQGMGLFANTEGNITVDKGIEITAKNSTTNFASLAEGENSKVELKGTSKLTAEGGSGAFGFVAGLQATASATGYLQRVEVLLM